MVSRRPSFESTPDDARASPASAAESAAPNPVAGAVAPSTRQLQRLADFVFGDDLARRASLVRTLMAFAVYVLCLCAVWAAVEAQHGNRVVASFQTAFCITGSLGFFIAIRCGLTARFADPALTLPQMVFAIACVAAACHIYPEFRGIQPTIYALVLVFGAFTLNAPRCTQLGRVAAVAFGATTALSLRRETLMLQPVTEIIYITLMTVILLTIAGLAGQLSQLRSNEKASRRTLRDVMERLKHLATEDVLTGLPNRRHVQEWMPHELARMRRSGEALCIALIDLDRFKRINDTFGHAAGDDALRIVAREARTALRDGDVLARWGGEEFILIMPATAIPEALITIDRIRARIALPSSWAAFPNSRVTFSAGLTVASASQTLEQALQWADFALYEAKAQGRNRTLVARHDDPISADRLTQDSVS